MAGFIAYLDGSEEHTEVKRHIRITIGEKAFKISVNNFDELVINKHDYSDDSNGLNIHPSVSNEIKIT